MVSSSAFGEETDPGAAEDVQDVLFLHDSRPILMRLHLFVDGKPYPTRWEAYLTACFLRRSQLPFSFPTDQACIEAGLDTCWQPNRDAVRMAIIPNTLEVEEMWVSAPLIEEARKRPHLEVTGDPQVLPFDDPGNLRQEVLFPHSVRGRRIRT